MRRVAYLTGRSYKGAALPPGALPSIEARDYALIAPAAARLGIAFEIAYWDDASLPERGFDAALIRSCWDYCERSDEFIATLHRHESAGLRVFNSAETVAWNARKTYLKQLGAAAIDTIWAEGLDARAVAQAFDAFDTAELVVKPQVGAGGQGALRLKRNSWSEADLRAGPRGAAMIQPYLKSIETEGERSLFWFGGVYSHAIRKAPHAGGWLANIPGKTDFIAEAPPPQALEAAESACAHAPDDMLYVRIDLVLGDDGKWRVIEIEAIEPYLFLAFAPEGAVCFVAALTRTLDG